MLGSIWQLLPRFIAAAASAARLALVALLPLWFVVPSSMAQIAWDEPVPVESLPAGAEALVLTGRIGHLVDIDGTSQIDALRSSGGAPRFAVPQGLIRAEADAPPQWFKIRLRRPDDAATREWVLALAALNLHEVRCFGPFREPDSSPSALSSSSDEPPSSPSVLAESGRFSFLIAPPGPGTYSVYLRATSVLPQHYALSIRAYAAHDGARQANRLIAGTSYGLMLGFMVFALILFWTFRDWVYLGFMSEIFAATATIALLDGHVTQYLLNGRAALADRLLPAMVGLWVAFALQRAYRHLGMRKQVPRLGRIVLGLTALSALAALAALAGALQLPSVVIASVAAAGFLLLPWALRPSPKFGYRFTSWYLVTSCWICLMAVLKMADLWALMPPWLGDYKVFQITVVALCMVFTVMYGDRLSRVWMKQGQLRQRTEELARAAETDPLTGLTNRSGMERRALSMLRERSACALLMIDLDRFKPINDRFGHSVGDAVLACVGERLRRASGPRDVAVRLGGDEFALLLADRHSCEALTEFAEDLIKSIGAPIEQHGRAHRVGASIGIARHPDDGDNLSRLLRCADLALYHAKHSGRGTFAFFQDLSLETSMLAAAP